MPAIKHIQTMLGRVVRIANQPSTITDERPIKAISARQGRFELLPTPGCITASPFPIFGPHRFDLVMQRKLPARSIARIKNGLVHGHSTATLTKRPAGTIHWVMAPELALANNPFNYARFFQAHDKGWQLEGNAVLTPTMTLDRAVLVGTRLSFNYFHFVTDLLVRLLIAEEQCVGDTAPLLVPALAPQLVELLGLVAPHRAVLTMGPNDLVQVGELLVPSSADFSPDDAPGSKAAVFDAPYLPTLCERLSRICVPSAHSQAKIAFIRRPDHYRGIVNQNEVVAFMESQGAAIIQPETMTMAAQINLFRQVEIVVGVAGAGLINSVFCRPGVSIIALCQNQIVNPEYFAFVADALTLHYSVVACEPVPGTHHQPSHLSVVADIDALKQAMAWAREASSTGLVIQRA
jgi:capsular polysaccharide biosynthesis protein